VSAGANRGGNAAVFGNASVGVVRLWPLGHRHVLATRAKGSSVIGTAPIQELYPLGGSDEALRGFPLEEVLAQQRAIASAEWRHPLLWDLDVDLFLTRLRKVSGALFVDGAVLGGLHARDAEAPTVGVFGDVGYGLRFQYDLGGVRPLILAVDAAVPIGRLDTIEDAAPITFSIRAGHAFTGP